MLHSCLLIVYIYIYINCLFFGIGLDPIPSFTIKAASLPGKASQPSRCIEADIVAADANPSALPFHRKEPMNCISSIVCLAPNQQVVGTGIFCLVRIYFLVIRVASFHYSCSRRLAMVFEDLHPLSPA